ncbi:MAG: hypothetical protein RBR02_06495 [Desulfuromonadaceae bacterium]|nr:hypothetical protein [Desulfuromonadaceae bacterium]
MNNKELIKKYPFLTPRNVWTGKIVDDYDYSWTKLDEIPTGWRKAFGLQMVEELSNALGDYSKQYRVSQIKEKYGELRWYDFGAPEGVHDIIDKYTKMSRNICIVCGEPATKISVGYICPFCDDCIGDRQYDAIIDKSKEDI